MSGRSVAELVAEQVVRGPLYSCPRLPACSRTCWRSASMRQRRCPPIVRSAGVTRPAAAQRDKVLGSIPSARAASPVVASRSVTDAIVARCAANNAVATPHHTHQCGGCIVRRDHASVTRAAFASSALSLPTPDTEVHMPPAMTRNAPERDSIEIYCRDDTDAVVLRHLREIASPNGIAAASIRDLAAALPISTATARRATARLIDAGQLELVSRGTGGRYRSRFRVLAVITTSAA